MILTTTFQIEGRTIKNYLGLVAGETIVGANIIKDIFANIRDVVGGRVKSYEKTLVEARTTALSEMESRAQGLSADAVVGVQITYAPIGQMLMVNAVGTAVKLGNS